MEIYRIPRDQTQVRILLDDGRMIEGAIFTAAAGPNGSPETVLDRLLDPAEEFLPLAVGTDRLLLNKGGILLVEVPPEAAADLVPEEGATAVLVRVTLAGGTSLLGRLAIQMPQERSRVLDYLNAAPRFLPVLGEQRVALLQKRFIVSVRGAAEGE